MDIKNLRTFLQIVETNNFTRAAEILGYSQSAVTAQIKQLESELQAPLFDRLGKRICLTSQGERFLPHALKLVREEDETLADLDIDQNLSGTIRIGTSSSLADWVLSEICSEFSKINPDVRFLIKTADMIEYLHDSLREGIFDFVYANYENPPMDNYEIAFEYDEPMVFIANSNHKLSKRKKLTMDEVLEYPFHITDHEVGYMNVLLNAIRKKDIELNPMMEIASVRGLIHIIENGDGVSYVPYYSVASEVKAGKIAILNVDLDVAITKGMLIHHKDKWVDPAMRAFTEFFKEFSADAYIANRQ